MNTVSNHIMMPYAGYGYPVVTETLDYLLAQYERQGYRFDNSRFLKGFRYNSFTFNIDKSAGLYNKQKQVEPLAMQMIGTAIDLYAWEIVSTFCPCYGTTFHVKFERVSIQPEINEDSEYCYIKLS